jgi:hypothetical protein
MPTPMGVLARIISGYDAPPPQGELRSTYKPQRQQAPIIEPVAPITTPAAPARTEMSSFDFAPENDNAQFVQTGDPRYMPGGEFDAFMEQVGSLPAFDKYRDDPVRMRAIFEEYLKTQGGSN